jgi:cytidyltransferase-like protein
MYDRYAFFPGRYQPLHEGHKKLIQVALDEGKKVIVGLQDMPVVDDKNPYSVEERKAMFFEAFGDKVECIAIPPIQEICWGRNVGWRPRRIHLDEETERISATGIRGNVASPEPAKSEWHDEEFRDAWTRKARKVHNLMSKDGFWQKGDKRPLSDPIALAHSELSEALECARYGNPPDKNIKDMGGVSVQLSDVLGILLDMDEGYGLKLVEALEKKMEFNESRGWLHGKQIV